MTILAISSGVVVYFRNVSVSYKIIVDLWKE